MKNVCQVCKKARATVHLTEIDPESSAPTQMHLCEECAAKAGGKENAGGKPAGAVFGLAAVARAREGRNVRCPTCGMTYQEFRLKGRLGCADCYEAFQAGLVGLLERIHGRSVHTGPRPPGHEDPRLPETGEEEARDRTGRTPENDPRIELEEERQRLRRLLERAVCEENYEEAARLRDRIREVERRLTEHTDAGS